MPAIPVSLVQPPADQRLTLWLVTDGKPGHRTQLEGMSRALARHAQVDARWIDLSSDRGHGPLATGAGALVQAWLFKRFPPGEGLPDPDIIVGCGHATHLPLLAARRARGGFAVVLMRPSLPLSWFDLCVIPRHDRPPERPNVMATHGVLNTARVSVHQKPAQGLFLVGGPSKHHQWDEKTLLTQIRQVVKDTPGMHWALTTSRRTPPATVEALKGLRRAGVEVIPFEQTDPGWVIDAITVSSQVWVTEDSVSMIYESLTSGAATGILWVPRKDRDRVTEGVEQLVKEGRVTPFLAWQQTRALARQETPINEADRVAAGLFARMKSNEKGEAS